MLMYEQAVSILVERNLKVVRVVDYTVPYEYILTAGDFRHTCVDKAELIKFAKAVSKE